MIERGKKGQVTIFIIVGLVVLVGVLLYFLLPSFFGTTLDKNFEPAYNHYLACLSERTELGISILGQQGGYIYTNELPFETGSAYMPTSSQLDFFGTPVAYWIYVSGNNFVREQKPTISGMETELERFVREGINDCSFSDFNNEGIFVDVYDGEVNVVIKENSVEAVINNPVFFSSEENSASVSKHSLKLDSKLGKYYNLASDFYNVQKSDAVLEAYSLDVLRLYAPVTGVDVTCAPKIFNENQIKQEISQALELNIAYLKLKGNYYTLADAQQNYYSIDLGKNINENVNFIYSSAWPTKIEMYGDKFVEPLGNQEGINMLGLCFVPYHFVYDMTFPVLVQFYDEKNLFQFPISVIIKNTQPREALGVSEQVSLDSPICINPTQNVSVSVFDLDLKPISASLSFKCLTESCNTGTIDLSKGSNQNFLLPSCVNGVLSAYAEGYAPANYIISTNQETKANILLKKIYPVNVDLGNVQRATVIFSSSDYGSSISYPEQKTLELIEGDYNVTIFVYENSTITFPGVKDRKCFQVPQESFGALFGLTEENCFDIDIPAQQIDQAISGGGRSSYYLSEFDFKNYKELNINVPLFKKPSNLQDLQDNYADWEVSTLTLSWE